MLLTNGNYKSIFTQRIEKYGSIEPVIDTNTIAMKLENPKKPFEKRTQQFAK